MESVFVFSKSRVRGASGTSFGLPKNLASSGSSSCDGVGHLQRTSSCSNVRDARIKPRYNMPSTDTGESNDAVKRADAPSTES